MAEPPANAGKSTGVPQFEVTPEMIEAGAAVIRRFFSQEEILPDDERDIAAEVYGAMASASRVVPSATPASC